MKAITKLLNSLNLCHLFEEIYVRPQNRYLKRNLAECGRRVGMFGMIKVSHPKNAYIEINTTNESSGEVLAKVVHRLVDNDWFRGI